jgi:hypothetical protein
MAYLSRQLSGYLRGNRPTTPAVAGVRHYSAASGRVWVHLLARVVFHPPFGYSIHDISFTPQILQGNCEANPMEQSRYFDADSHSSDQNFAFCTDDSLLCSQEPSTGCQYKAADCCLHSKNISYFKIHFNIILLSTHGSPKLSSSFIFFH